MAAGVEERSLSGALRRWLSNFDEQRLWPLIEEALSDDRLVLLVDGLDEWSNADAAGIVFDHLQVFVDQRDTPLVATSRPVAFERLGSPPRSWAVGELAPLSRPQQLELVANALRSKTRDGLENEAAKRRGEAERFVDELERASDLRELAGVPLLLLVLLWLHRRDAHLPEGRFAAYSRLVEYLVVDYPLRRRRAASVIEPERLLSMNEIKNTLAKLAFAIHQTGGDAVPVADAEATARDYLVDEELGPGLERGEARRLSAELVREAREVLGLLVEYAPATIGFFHRSLLEHLVAVHVSTWPLPQQLELTGQIGADSHWREVILNLVHLTQRTNDTDETNASAASELARAWGRRRRDAALPDDEATVLRPITDFAPIDADRRQAVLVALIECELLDRFADAREGHMPEKPPVTVLLTDYWRPNLVLAEAVVEHWSDFVTACGPDFPERLGHSDDVATVWDLLALFADKSDAAREATLAYMARKNALSVNLLRFCAAVHPRSEGLLELCLRALQGEVGRSRPRDLVVEAAETLGEHFGGDQEVLERISTSSNALPKISRLLALAEGWPESDELRTAAEDAQAHQIRAPFEAIVRVGMAVSPPERAFEILRAHLELIEPDPESRDRAIGSIVRRLHRDSVLAELLAAAISDSAPPREIASLPRLLANAGSLTPETRDACEAFLGRTLEGDLVHLIGLDLVEGRRRAVAFALADALGAAPI